jgi:hypothetical protein
MIANINFINLRSAQRTIVDESAWMGGELEGHPGWSAYFDQLAALRMRSSRYLVGTRKSPLERNSVSAIQVLIEFTAG